MNQHPEVRDVVCKAPLEPQGPEKQAEVVSVEGRGDDAGEGAVPGTGAPATPPVVAPVRHILPQIPTMSHSRLAVSKASRKVEQHSSTLYHFTCMHVLRNT